MLTVSIKSDCDVDVTELFRLESDACVLVVELEGTLEDKVAVFLAILRRVGQDSVGQIVFIPTLPREPRAATKSLARRNKNRAKKEEKLEKIHL